MPTSYYTDILYDATTLLETICPEEILLLGSTVENITKEYQQQCKIINKPCNITQVNPTTLLTDPAFSKRYELAIISEIIESKNKQHSEHLLGRLRDLCSPRIIILANLENSLWQENELFGFGFSKYNSQQCSDQTVSIYHYNIDIYKRTPDWFNPKNWSNPQLWNKFWW